MIDREKVVNDLQDAVNDDWLWRHADYYALTMERAITLLKEDCHNCKLECLLQKYDELKEKYDALLKEQPEIIIRCKDCQNGGIDSTSYPDYWCSAHSEYHDGEFFCAYGKQKDS